MYKHILLDADIFVSYLIGDKLFEHSAKVIKSIASEALSAYVSSEIYDDIVSILRSNGVPYKPLPLTLK